MAKHSKERELTHYRYLAFDSTEKLLGNKYPSEKGQCCGRSQSE
jgi:hypothetical protein